MSWRGVRISTTHCFQILLLNLSAALNSGSCYGRWRKEWAFTNPLRLRSHVNRPNWPQHPGQEINETKKHFSVKSAIGGHLLFTKQLQLKLGSTIVPIPTATSVLVSFSIWVEIYWSGIRDSSWAILGTHYYRTLARGQSSVASPEENATLFEELSIIQITNESFIAAFNTQKCDQSLTGEPWPLQYKGTLSNICTK